MHHLILPFPHPRDLAARSMRSTFGGGYTSLAEHLMQFKSLRHVPVNIDVDRLDDGDGIEATLLRLQACWH